MQESTKRRVVHANDAGWDGVPVEGYRPGAAIGIERHTLLGARKSAPTEDGPSLEMRYFELQPGAATRLEKHKHEHFVIVKRGLGHAIIGETATEIAADDVVYVGPLELHQFVNRGEEPFGFYCIVDAARDFSQAPASEELERLQASPAGQVAKPFAVPQARAPGS